MVNLIRVVFDDDNKYMESVWGFLKLVVFKVECIRWFIRLWEENMRIFIGILI